MRHTIQTAMKRRERRRREKKEEGRGLITMLISQYTFTVIESSMAPEEPRIELSVAENLRHAGRGSSQEATRKANSGRRIDSETARLAARQAANRRRKRGAGALRIGHAPRKSNAEMKNRKRIGQESSSRNRGLQTRFAILLVAWSGSPCLSCI